jgi:hypothetical protein
MRPIESTPYLLALAVGLIVLNVTCFIGMKASPPRPIGSELVQPTTTPELQAERIETLKRDGPTDAGGKQLWHPEPAEIRFLKVA